LFSAYKNAITILKESSHFSNNDEFFDLTGLVELYKQANCAVLLYNKIEAYIRLTTDKVKAVLSIYEIVCEMSSEHAAVFNRPDVAKNIERLVNANNGKKNGRVDSVNFSSPRSGSGRGSFEDRFGSNGSGNSDSDKNLIGKLGMYKPSGFRPQVGRNINKSRSSNKPAFRLSGEHHLYEDSLKYVVDGNAFSEDGNRDMDHSKDSFIKLSKTSENRAKLGAERLPPINFDFNTKTDSY